MAARLGSWIARYLTQRVGEPPPATVEYEKLAAALMPGDVLLVEGDTRISGIIKYLTQSTWSHAALYVGARTEIPLADGVVCDTVEADISDGVRAVPLAEHARLHTRICRPVGLSPIDREKVIQFAIARIGHHYDLKNVFDLARYLLPLPLPRRWRRRAIAFGSGDPTRAICSTLIAQAFQSVRYPILPKVTRERYGAADCSDCVRDFYRIRHHSLFAPRDFDISPYFAVVKPTLAAAADYRSITWVEEGERPPEFVDEPDDAEQAA
jgi:hypothetical protein